MATVFEAMGGAPAVLRLAHAWHERVIADVARELIARDPE